MSGQSSTNFTIASGDAAATPAHHNTAQKHTMAADSVLTTSIPLAPVSTGAIDTAACNSRVVEGPSRSNAQQNAQTGFTPPALSAAFPRAAIMMEHKRLMMQPEPHSQQAPPRMQTHNTQGVQQQIQRQMQNMQQMQLIHQSQYRHEASQIPMKASSHFSAGASNETPHAYVRSRMTDTEALKRRKIFESSNRAADHKSFAHMNNYESGASSDPSSNLSSSSLISATISGSQAGGAGADHKRGRGTNAEKKAIRDMYAKARNAEMRASLLAEQDRISDMHEQQSQVLAELTDEIRVLNPAMQLVDAGQSYADGTGGRLGSKMEEDRERKFNNTIKHYKEVLLRPFEKFETEQKKKKKKDKKNSSVPSDHLTPSSTSPACHSTDFSTNASSGSVDAGSKVHFVSMLEKDCFSVNAHIAMPPTSNSTTPSNSTNSTSSSSYSTTSSATLLGDDISDSGGKLIDSLLSIWQFFGTYSKTLGLRPPSVKIPLAPLGREAGACGFLGLNGGTTIGDEEVTLTSVEVNERRLEQEKQQAADEDYQKYLDENANTSQDVTWAEHSGTTPVPTEPKPRRRRSLVRQREIIAKVRPRKMLSAGTPIVPLDIDAALDSSDSEDEIPVDVPPSACWNSDLVPLLGGEPFALERFISVLKDPARCSDADQIWLDECHVRLLRPVLVELFQRLGQNTVVTQSSWWKDLRPRSLNAMTWPELARGLLCAIHYQDTAAMSRDAEVIDDGGTFGIYDQKRPYIICEASINCFESAPGRRAPRMPSRKGDRLAVQILQRHLESAAIAVSDDMALRHTLSIDENDLKLFQGNTGISAEALATAEVQDNVDVAAKIAASLAKKSRSLLSFSKEKNAEAGFECVLPTPEKYLGSVAFRGSSGEGYGWQMIDTSQFWEDDDVAVLEAEKIRAAVSNASGGTATKKQVAVKAARIAESVGNVERILSVFSKTVEQSVAKNMRAHVRHVRATLAAILSVRSQEQVAELDVLSKKSMVRLIEDAVNALDAANRAGTEEPDVKIKGAPSSSVSSSSSSLRTSSRSNSGRAAAAAATTAAIQASSSISSNDPSASALGNRDFSSAAESVTFSTNVLAPINQLRLQLQRACSNSVTDRPHESSSSAATPHAPVLPVSEIARRMAHEACYEYHRGILRCRARRNARRGEDRQKLLMSEAILAGDIGLPSKKKSHKKKVFQKGRKSKKKTAAGIIKEAAKRADDELFAQEMADAVAAQRDAMRELQEDGGVSIIDLPQDSVVTSYLSKEKMLRPEMRFCERVYRRLLSENIDTVDSFCIPIDLDVYTDYTDFVKTPLDLRTVYERLVVDGYCTPQAYIADVELVFENCKAYCKGKYPGMVQNAQTLLAKFHDILEDENDKSAGLIDLPALALQSPHFPLAVDPRGWEWRKLPNWCDNGCYVCGGQDQSQNILICSTCDGRYHIGCLKIQGKHIVYPKSWQCPLCQGGDAWTSTDSLVYCESKRRVQNLKRANRKSMGGTSQGSTSDGSSVGKPLGASLPHGIASVDPCAASPADFLKPVPLPASTALENALSAVVTVLASPEAQKFVGLCIARKYFEFDCSQRRFVGTITGFDASRFRTGDVVVVDYFKEEDYQGGDSAGMRSLEDREYLTWADLKAVVINGDILTKASALAWSTEAEDLLTAFETAQNGGHRSGSQENACESLEAMLETPEGTTLISSADMEHLLSEKAHALAFSRGNIVIGMVVTLLAKASSAEASPLTEQACVVHQFVDDNRAATRGAESTVILRRLRDDTFLKCPLSLAQEGAARARAHAVGNDLSILAEEDANILKIDYSPYNHGAGIIIPGGYEDTAANEAAAAALAATTSVQENAFDSPLNADGFRMVMGSNDIGGLASRGKADDGTPKFKATGVFAMARVSKNSHWWPCEIYLDPDVHLDGNIEENNRVIISTSGTSGVKPKKSKKKKSKQKTLTTVYFFSDDQFSSVRPSCVRPIVKFDDFIAECRAFAKESSGNARSARRKMNRGIRGIESRLDVIERKGVDGVETEDDEDDDDGSGGGDVDDSFNSNESGKYVYDREKPWTIVDQRKQSKVPPRLLKSRRRVARMARGTRSLELADKLGTEEYSSLSFRDRVDLLHILTAHAARLPCCQDVVDKKYGLEASLRVKIEARERHRLAEVMHMAGVWTRKLDAANAMQKYETKFMPPQPGSEKESAMLALKKKHLAERNKPAHVIESDETTDSSSMTAGELDRSKEFANVKISAKARKKLIREFTRRHGPRPNVNSYIHFMKAEQDAIRDKMQADASAAIANGTSLPKPDSAAFSGRVFADRWHHMSAHEKEPWIQRATADKIRYAGEMRAFKETKLAKFIARLPEAHENETDDQHGQGHGASMDSSSDEQSSAEDIAPSSAYNYYNYDADYSSDEDGYLIATSAKAKRRKAAKEKVKASILRAEALASSSSSSRNSIAQTSSTKQQISDADISSLRDKRKREDRDGVSKRAKNENIMLMSDHEDGDDSDLDGADNVGQPVADNVEGEDVRESRKRPRDGDVVSKPEKKKVKRRQKKGARIKAMSAWGFFMKKRRGELAQKGGVYGGMKAIMAKLAAEWKAMAPDERVKYDALAAEDRIKTDLRKAEQNKLLAMDADAHAREKLRRKALGYEEKGGSISFDETLKKWRVCVRWLGLKHFVAYCDTKAEAAQEQIHAMAEYTHKDIMIRKSIFEKLSQTVANSSSAMSTKSTDETRSLIQQKRHALNARRSQTQRPSSLPLPNSDFIVNVRVLPSDGAKKLERKGMLPPGNNLLAPKSWPTFGCKGYTMIPYFSDRASSTDVMVGTRYSLNVAASETERYDVHIRKSATCPACRVAVLPAKVRSGRAPTVTQEVCVCGGCGLLMWCGDNNKLVALPPYERVAEPQRQNNSPQYKSQYSLSCTFCSLAIPLGIHLVGAVANAQSCLARLHFGGAAALGCNLYVPHHTRDPSVRGECPVGAVLRCTRCGSANAVVVTKEKTSPAVQLRPVFPCLEAAVEMRSSVLRETIFPWTGDATHEWPGSTSIGSLGAIPESVDSLGPFHTNKTIFPVGYIARRSFRVTGGARGKNAKDRSSVLKLEIVQGSSGRGARPVFRVTNETELAAPVVEGYNLEEVWGKTVTMLEEILRKNDGKSSSPSSRGAKAGANAVPIRKALNGLNAFGLMLPGIQDRLQGLRGSEKCENYVWSNLRGVYGIQNTICGGVAGSGVVSLNGGSGTIDGASSLAAVVAPNPNKSVNGRVLPDSNCGSSPTTTFTIPGFDCVTLTPAVKRLVIQTRKMRHDARIKYRRFKRRLAALAKAREAALAAKRDRDKRMLENKSTKQSKEDVALEAKSVITSKRFPSAMLLRFARIFDQRTSILDSIHARVRMGLRDVQLGQDRFGNRYWIAGGNWARVLVHVDCPPSVDPRGGGRYTEALESEYALHPGKWFSVNSVYGLKQLLSFLLERDHTEGPLRFAIQKLVPLLLRTMKKTMAAQQMRQNRSRQSRAVISEEYVESAGLLGGLCPLLALFPQKLSDFSEERQRVREALAKIRRARSRRRRAKQKRLEEKAKREEEDGEKVHDGDKVESEGEDKDGDGGDKYDESSDEESSAEESESESESESDLDSESDFDDEDDRMPAGSRLSSELAAAAGPLRLLDGKSTSDMFEHMSARNQLGCYVRFQLSTLNNKSSSPGVDAATLPMCISYRIASLQALLVGIIESLDDIILNKPYDFAAIDAKRKQKYSREALANATKAARGQKYPVDTGMGLRTRGGTLMQRRLREEAVRKAATAAAAIAEEKAREKTKKDEKALDSNNGHRAIKSSRPVPTVMSTHEQLMFESKKRVALKRLVLEAKTPRELMACLLMLESSIQDTSLTHWWVGSYRPFSVQGNMRKAAAKAIAAAAKAADKAVSADKDAAAAAAARAHTLRKKIEDGVDAASSLLTAPTTALVASRAMALRSALAKGHAKKVDVERYGNAEAAAAAKRAALLSQSKIVDRKMHSQGQSVQSSLRFSADKSHLGAERDGSGGGVGGEAAPDPALGAVAAKSRVNMGLPPLEILLLDRAGPLTRDIAWTFDGSVEPGTSTKAAMFLEGLAFGDETVA